jgi:hypothetical protein
MLFTKLTLFLTLFAYTVIVGQSFMYIIALKNVQTSMPAGSYIQLRKLLDAGFRANFKYAVYAALLFNLLLVVSTAVNAGSLLFITPVISLIALVADVLLTIKGNMPINKLINTWTADRYPADWESYRDRWLAIFRYRQLCNLTGFTCLLAGAIFGSR